MHIHLLLHGFDRILDTAFFSPLLGSFCADGEQAYCDKFTSIMITGYGILAILLIIAATSVVTRFPTKFSLTSSFSMYIIVIQTFDMSQRKGHIIAEPDLQVVLINASLLPL
jgi:hypothetical protein